MKKNNGFFLVSLWTCVAIGAVCCVAITSKAHKVTIREMRDKTVIETIRTAKEIGGNLKEAVNTNIAYLRSIIKQHGRPKKHSSFKQVCGCYSKSKAQASKYISRVGKKVLEEK